MQIFKQILLVLILINLGFVLVKLTGFRKLNAEMEDGAKKGLTNADAEKNPMAEKKYRENDAKEESPSDGKEDFSDFDASHFSESDREFLGQFHMKW